MEDLKDDLMRIGKDLYLSAVDELEEIHDEVKTGDILYLGKKLLRNVNNITKIVEQIENFRDFITDVSPLTRESFINFINKLDEYERKGYFAFIKESGKILDNIVTSFTVEDVMKLGNNIVTILNTIKNLTQPDMLNAVNNMVNVYKHIDSNVEKDVSLIRLMKEMNRPETRRGMMLALNMLKNLSAQENNKQS